MTSCIKREDIDANEQHHNPETKAENVDKDPSVIYLNVTSDAIGIEASNSVTDLDADHNVTNVNADANVKMRIPEALEERQKADFPNLEVTVTLSEGPPVHKVDVASNCEGSGKSYRKTGK